VPPSDWLELVERSAVFTFLVSSMGAVGLSLTGRAIIAPLRNPRLVAVALVLNFAVAPLLAWLVTTILPLDRGHANGLFLLAGAAGAPFLPKLVETARGEPAVAAAMMVLLTAGTILFMPFGLPLMIPGLQADAWGIARPLVLFIVLPLAVGILIKRYAAAAAARAAPVLAAIGNASLLLFFALLIMLNSRALLGVIGSGAILAALLFIIGLLAIAWLLGQITPDSRETVALATAARNFGAALVPAASSFGDSKVTLMLIVSAIVCLVITFLAAAWMRKRKSLAVAG
jgi:predicted Na+-dependent transporter